MSRIEPADMHRIDGEIIPPELAVKAMRDSGYKNTAYALAELIDNSVQAHATSVEVICIEEYRQVNERTRRRVRAIGILDNGEGMTPETLRLALQFGKWDALVGSQRYRALRNGAAELVHFSMPPR